MKHPKIQPITTLSNQKNANIPQQIKNRYQQDLENAKKHLQIGKKYLRKNYAGVFVPVEIIGFLDNPEEALKDYHPIFDFINVIKYKVPEGIELTTPWNSFLNSPSKDKDGNPTPLD